MRSYSAPASGSRGSFSPTFFSSSAMRRASLDLSASYLARSVSRCASFRAILALYRSSSARRCALIELIREPRAFIRRSLSKFCQSSASDASSMYEKISESGACSILSAASRHASMFCMSRSVSVVIAAAASFKAASFSEVFSFATALGSVLAEPPFRLRSSSRRFSISFRRLLMILM